MGEIFPQAPSRPYPAGIGPWLCRVVALPLVCPLHALLEQVAEHWEAQNDGACMKWVEIGPSVLSEGWGLGTGDWWRREERGCSKVHEALSMGCGCRQDWPSSTGI